MIRTAGATTRTLRSTGSRRQIIARYASTEPAPSSAIGRRGRSKIASAASTINTRVSVQNDASCIKISVAKNVLPRGRTSSSSASFLGPEPLRTNVIAAQYLGNSLTASHLDPLSSVHAPQEVVSSRYLERGVGPEMMSAEDRTSSDRTEALVKLVRMLLLAENVRGGGANTAAASSASIGTSARQQFESPLSVEQSTRRQVQFVDVSVEQQHEEVEEEEQQQGVNAKPSSKPAPGNTFKEEQSTNNSDGDEWWEDAPPAQQQQPQQRTAARQQTIRSNLYHANRTYEILSSMVRDGRLHKTQRVPKLMEYYRRLVHFEDEIAAARAAIIAAEEAETLLASEESAEANKDVVKGEFKINLGLFPKLIMALPRHDLVNKMEVLERYIAAVDSANAALEEEERDVTADDDNEEEANASDTSMVNDDGISSSSGINPNTPAKQRRFEVDRYALSNICESVGAYASHRRSTKVGPAGTRKDRDLTRYVLSAVHYLGDYLANVGVEITQHKCLPRLMASAVSVSSSTGTPLWEYAADIFWHMVEHKFPIDYKIYNHVLRLSTFRNTAVFPFWKVLKIVEHVEEGRLMLDMKDALNVLHNYHPYMDGKATKSVMRSILSLQQQDATISEDADTDGGAVDAPMNTSPMHVDRGTLNTIASAGSIACDPDMVLMAFDLADQAGYAPSIDMYESIVVAFAAAGLQDHNAFAVLAEIEAAGIVPSKTLIRAFGRYIKSSSGRLDNAYYILENRTEGTAITTASLNVVMSACAQCGDSDGAFVTYGAFDQYNIIPDANTFFFLMEAIGTSMTADWAKKFTSDEIERNVTAAREVLTSANDYDAMSPDVLHQFLRTLCAAGHLEECLETLQAAIGRDERVLMETFSLVAVRLAKAGEFKEAHQVAQKMYPEAGYGKIPTNIIGRIINLQRRQPKEKDLDAFHIGV